MKEVTHIITLQFTMIAKGSDEDVADVLQNGKRYTEEWVKRLKKACTADDILLLDDKFFVRDMED